MKNPIANNRSAAMLLGALTFALTLIGVVLRALTLYLKFDMSVGYYTPSLLVSVMNIFLVLSVVAFGVLSFVMIKKLELEAVESEKDPTVKVIALFAAIGVLAYIIAKSYFDIYFAMNSPNKILLHMAALAAMFLFVTLARLAIGTLKGRSYLFFLTATVFLSGTYAIPSVFFSLISKIYREYTYFNFDIIILAVFVFATLKLIALMTATKPEVLTAADESVTDTETVTTEEDTVSENTNEE